jgi:hypothetical protein
MLYAKVICGCGFVLFVLSPIFAADVILNEYNAVDSTEFLNGGDALSDLNGSQASDSFFGRIPGNGGDWFELIVITDHLDMRYWNFSISSDDGLATETLRLTDHDIWSDLRSGTIITVAEDVPSDISYCPGAGDWWINVQANDNADGLLISASSFPVNSKDWQLTISNSSGAIVFGPAGEGISPLTGVGNTEIFKLQANPNADIMANSQDYDDADNLSTFGAPNSWGMQEVEQLRSVIAESGSILLLCPVGLEIIDAASIYTIEWDSQADTESVKIEFSIDNGIHWHETFPPNTGNTGQYHWLVPLVNSSECMVRIVSRSNPALFDMTGLTFTIQSAN